MFEKAEQNEIMFIAQNMKAAIFVEDEKIVYQGDVGRMVFIINSGTAVAQLRQSALDNFTGTVTTMINVKIFAKKLKKNMGSRMA